MGKKEDKTGKKRGILKGEMMSGVVAGVNCCRNGEEMIEKK